MALFARTTKNLILKIDEFFDNVEIGIGWLATPVMSGLLAFLSLFFMKNIFNIDVGHKIAAGETISVTMTGATGGEMSGIVKYLLLAIFITGTFLILYFYLLDRKKKRELKASEEKFWKNVKTGYKSFRG
jgi:phosphate/sulfate permease